MRVVGHKEVPGRPALYGSTQQFLDYFNMKSLDEMPSLAELKDLDLMHPELELPRPQTDNKSSLRVVTTSGDLAEGQETRH